MQYFASKMCIIIYRELVLVPESYFAVMLIQKTYPCGRKCFLAYLFMRL